MLLEGKVVIVTGAGRGIGAAIARVLAREGATVAVNYAHSKDKAEAVVAEIMASGGKAQAFAADVRSESDVTSMMETVHSAFGRIDGLVNNSIAGKQNGAFAETVADDFSNAFRFRVSCSCPYHAGSAGDHEGAGRRDGSSTSSRNCGTWLRRIGRSTWRARARWSAYRGLWRANSDPTTSQSTWSRRAGWQMKRLIPLPKVRSISPKRFRFGCMAVRTRSETDVHSS